MCQDKKNGCLCNGTNREFLVGRIDDLAKALLDLINTVSKHESKELRDAIMAAQLVLQRSEV